MTLAAVQAWVPQWLRFTDEQPVETETSMTDYMGDLEAELEAAQ